MTKNLEAGEVGGSLAVAIYSGNLDGLPLADPYGQLARLKFHSSLKYLGFVPSATLSATIATPATVNSRQTNVTIGAHGQAGIPFVFGMVQVGGVWVPLKGSVPVSVLSTGHAKWWALTIDATSVYISELRSRPTVGAALSLPVMVFISDRLT